jgi:hypothetical protein
MLILDTNLQDYYVIENRGTRIVKLGEIFQYKKRSITRLLLYDS